MSRQLKIQRFRKAEPLRPLPDDDRRLKTPQWDAKFGRRWRKNEGPKHIPRLRNGKRLKDIIRRLEFHRSANRDDFIRHRADYMIAAACHCPDSQHLEDWLPQWCIDHLFVPDFPNLEEKMQVVIACEPGRLSAEEVAELLPTTFDERQALKLWTFGTIDMSPLQRKRRSKKERQRKERERRAKNRLAAGAKPHAESLSQTQPWLALGKSRRQWERLRKAGKLWACRKFVAGPLS
jgi:hypothetical protein